MHPAIALAFACAIAFGFTYADHAPLIPLLAADLGLDDLRAGLLSTVSFLANLIATLLGIGLIDRLGPKRAITVGLVATTLGTALVSIAPGYGTVLGGKLLQGAGSGVAFVAAARYIAAIYGERRSHFAIGIFGSGFPLGSGLALIVMPVLATTLGGWHEAYGAEAAMIGAVAVAWAVFAPTVRSDATPRDIRAALTCGNCWLTSLQHAAGFGLALSSGTWITVYLLRVFSLPLTLSGVLGSGLLALAVAGRTTGGWLLAREHVPTRVLMRGGELAILAGVVLLALPDRPLALALAGALLVGIGVGLPYAAVFNTAAASLRGTPAAAQGLAAAGGTAGAMLGAPLMGYAVQTYGFGAAWSVVGAVALVALGGTFAMRGEEDLP
ncbi:MAG TPA: MFS transporter [Candidatus Acidoferrales bacterium]|nr:MFS transporter [Candidatus Acidoferrales bacterium]